MRTGNRQYQFQVTVPHSIIRTMHLDRPGNLPGVGATSLEDILRDVTEALPGINLSSLEIPVLGLALRICQ